MLLPGPIEQLVLSLTADPGVFSLILARSHTFIESDHEIFSRVILLPLIQEGLLSVKSDRKYVYKVLVACPGKIDMNLLVKINL